MFNNNFTWGYSPLLAIAQQRQGNASAPNPNSWQARKLARQQPDGFNVFSDPFGTALSGGVQGTLQPYINMQNANAYGSLYGGLLGYSPQNMTAGNAGGTPTTATGAQFELPSLLSNFEGFGNRSWMKG